MIDRTGRRYWFIGAFFLIAAGLVWLWAFGAATAFGMLLGYMLLLDVARLDEHDASSSTPPRSIRRGCGRSA